MPAAPIAACSESAAAATVSDGRRATGGRAPEPARTDVIAAGAAPLVGCVAAAVEVAVAGESCEERRKPVPPAPWGCARSAERRNRAACAACANEAAQLPLLALAVSNGTLSCTLH